MSDEPTMQELRRFIEVFEALSRFDAETRMIRGYGAAVSPPFPVPEVVKTMAWLSQLACVTDITSDRP